MDYLKKVLDTANQIKDKELRKKVIDILKHPKLSNKNFKYKGMHMGKAPASLNWHHVFDGGLAKHTYVVATLCLDIADVLEKNYDMEINRDNLLSGAILHDIAKLFEMRKNGRAFDTTELNIDHVIMGSAELYARGFPEPVVHMVASHFGEQGTTSPQSVEALILHHADNLSAVVGTSGIRTLGDTGSVISLALGD